MNDFIHAIIPSVDLPFIFISIPGAIILFVVSAWGKRRGFYKKGNFWFDDIMHFSGGLLVAVFCSGFIKYWPLVISLTFLVGVLWEIQEYFRGIYIFKKYGTKDDLIEARDSFEDLACDLAGCIVWLFIIMKII
jgi:hypothetical protein